MSAPVQPRILGLILARGGSKRLPGKNVRPLHGKPLIAWTVEAARARPAITTTAQPFSASGPDTRDTPRTW